MRIVLAALVACAPLAAQERFALPNGLQVRLLENHERPLVQAWLELRWAAPEEAAAEAAGSLLGSVLANGGAGPFGPAAFRRTLEEQGLRLDFEAAPGRYRWSLQCASGSQEAAFALLAHAVARPEVDGPAVELQRARLQREAQRRSPAEWAALRFAWEVLEARPEALPTEARLGRLSLDQVGAFQRRVLAPARATLVLQGDLSTAQARQLALLHFGVWGPSRAAAPTALRKAAPPWIGIALATGAPEATLALPAPEGGEAAQELLLPLLARALGQPPAELPRAVGRLGQAQGRPCLVLQVKGAAASDPLALLAGLRRWAEHLATLPLEPADLALARGLLRSEEAAAALHPSLQMGRALEPGRPAAPPEPAALRAALKDWCAPPRMRVLLQGLSALPKEHPALTGLGPVAWVDPGE